MGESSLHVAMVPWLAFGHMIPFLHLAIALAKAGIRISFLCTPKNILRLPKVPVDLAALIRFVEIPLPAVDGLPEDAEATVDISPEQIQYLKIAHDTLQLPLKQFIADEAPDWIVHDYVVHWVADSARDFNLPCILFSVFSASSATFFGPPEALIGDGQRRFRPSPESMTSKPQWVSFPSTVAYRRHEAEAMHRGFYGMNASGINDSDRIGLTVEGCQALAVRSCYEYEGEYFDLLQRLSKRPVIPVGLLPPPAAPPGTGHSTMTGDWLETFKWLDEQKPRSVVFVGFGTECKLSKDQVYELAHGLEVSDLPFLWALRRPTWASNDEEALPMGFAGRTSGRGVVSMGWAPQPEILAHSSIGGSLFHSGWGSIIETLRHGLALVVLPLVIEQGLNARLLVEKGLALEVEREEDGSFHGEAIAKCLRESMVAEEGEALRVKAREMGVKFADQALQDQYLSKFVDYLLCHGRINQSHISES